MKLEDNVYTSLTKEQLVINSITGRAHLEEMADLRLSQPPQGELELGDAD